MSKLCLSLDDLFDGEYIHTSYDIGGRGHEVVIEEAHREEFLEELAQEFAERADGLLEDCDDCEEEEDE